jgi:arylsulfatase A-like enzyme
MKLQWFVSAASLAAVSAAPEAAKAPKPHVLFLLADDLGWANIGFHRTTAKTEDEKQGQLEVQTPTINQLVKEGHLAESSSSPYS